MKRNTLIEHKEAIVVCEESGPINLSYNVLLTTPKDNTVVKLVVPIVTTKSTLTYTNCGKTGHSVETCYNKKREVSIMPTITIKSIEPVIRTKTQPIKSGKILICYPYIICYNAEHRFRKCPRKIEIQNMLKTKPISFNVMTALQQPKTNNVLVNVIVAITTHS
jgi:hypothetical protein